MKRGRGGEGREQGREEDRGGKDTRGKKGGGGKEVRPMRYTHVSSA